MKSEPVFNDDLICGIDLYFQSRDGEFFIMSVGRDDGEEDEWMMIAKIPPEEVQWIDC